MGSNSGECFEEEDFFRLDEDAGVRRPLTGVDTEGGAEGAEPVLDVTLYALRSPSQLFNPVPFSPPPPVYFPYIWPMNSGWSLLREPVERNSYTPESGIELKSPQKMRGI